MTGLESMSALDWVGCIGAGVALGLAFSVVIRALADGGRW